MDLLSNKIALLLKI